MLFLIHVIKQSDNHIYTTFHIKYKINTSINDNIYFPLDEYEIKNVVDYKDVEYHNKTYFEIHETLLCTHKKIICDVSKNNIHISNSRYCNELGKVMSFQSPYITVLFERNIYIKGNNILMFELRINKNKYDIKKINNNHNYTYYLDMSYESATNRNTILHIFTICFIIILGLSIPSSFYYIVTTCI